MPTTAVPRRLRVRRVPVCTAAPLQPALTVPGLSRPIQGFDQAVRCRALEEQNERVQPQQNSQARAVWSKYSVGGWVSIVGISGRPELNGLSALIVEYVPDRERCAAPTARTQLMPGLFWQLSSTITWRGGGFAQG